MDRVGNRLNAVQTPPGKPEKSTRRQFLIGAGAVGVGIGASSILSACGDSSGQSGPVPKDTGGPPDMAAAKDEGTVVVWYSEQEKPMTTYINKFTEATGISAEGVRVASSDQIRKLEDAKRAGKSTVDVIMTADPGVAHRLQSEGYLKRYVSEEMDAYPAQFKSDEVGWWTAFYLAVEAIGYEPDHVTTEGAPQTYLDLLSPEWKDRLAFQDSTAGSQYLWWYVLKDKLPGDYFEKLKLQNPAGFPSSTAIVQALRSGNILVAGKFSDFQFAVAERDGQPLGSVYPEMGVVAGPHGISLLEASRRPNAGKAFLDYTISADGQKEYNTVAGSRSARPGVSIEGVQSLGNQKLLTLDPKNFEDFASAERSAEFQQVWRSVVGS